MFERLVESWSMASIVMRRSTLRLETLELPFHFVFLLADARTRLLQKRGEKNTLKMYSIWHIQYMII
jgi:hypothetical protein